MSISRGGFHLAVAVAKELPNHGQALAERKGAGGDAVSQVMDADIVQTGARPDDLPGVGDIAEMRAPCSAGDDPWVIQFTREASEQLHRHRWQGNHPSTRLAVREAQLRRVKGYILPAER